MTALVVPHLITPDEANTLNLWPGDDGKPHVTYYDKERSLSFVWDGLLPYITVAWQGYGEPPRWLIPVCAAEGSCLRPPRGGAGLCNMHRQRLTKYERLYRVKSEGPSTYTSAHAAIRRLRGPARDYPCLGCDDPAIEWAYVGGCSHEQVEGKLRFSLDLTRYIPLCQDCHTELDSSGPGLSYCGSWELGPDGQRYVCGLLPRHEGGHVYAERSGSTVKHVEPVSARVDLIAFTAVCLDWVGKHWRYLPPHAFPPVRVPHEVTS